MRYRVAGALLSPALLGVSCRFAAAPPVAAPSAVRAAPDGPVVAQSDAIGRPRDPAVRERDPIVQRPDRGGQQPRRQRHSPADRRHDAPADDGPPPRTFGRTRVRLMVFREELEFDELDIDYGDGGSGGVFDWQRERLGFRAEFGRANAGFFQVFTEDLEAPSLLGAKYDLFGLGGGVTGHPTVGRAGPVELAVPYRWALNMAFGSENVGGADGDIWYGESVFELGFAARAYGAQLSSGVVVNSLAGWYESDDVVWRSTMDDSEITGTNYGAYFEALYKHPRVPLVARARAMVGDLEGFLLTFGFAF